MLRMAEAILLALVIVELPWPAQAHLCSPSMRKKSPSLWSKPLYFSTCLLQHPSVIP
jgi:hypothetical protein